MNSKKSLIIITAVILLAGGIAAAYLCIGSGRNSPAKIRTGWVTDRILRVEGHGKSSPDIKGQVAAAESSRRAAILDAKSKAAEMTGVVKEIATKDGWIKEYYGFVQAGDIISEKYSADKTECFIILEVKFNR